MTVEPLPPSALLLAALLAGASGCQRAAHVAKAELPPAPVRVQVLAINDFHGQLEPPSGSGGRVTVAVRPDGSRQTVDAGGAVHLAAHLARLRKENPNTVVVSAGDLVGASPLLSALFRDEPTIEAMNAMGLTLHAVGNHEFDRGRAELLRLARGGCHPEDVCRADAPFPGARFTFLAANVLGPDGGALLAPYAVRTFEGVNVAFIGVTLAGTPTIVQPSGVAGLTFRDEVETVNALVPRLRAEGVEAFVLLVHEGAEHSGPFDGCEGATGPVLEMARAVDDAVDVLVTGHTHAAYNCLVDGKRVTSALSAGRLVTDLDLTLDRTSGEVLEVRARNVVVTRETEGAPEVQAVIDRAAARAAPLRDRVVGRVVEALSAPRHVTTPSGESTLGNVMADAQLAATQAEALGGAELALVNPGGIRADLPAGDVTYGAAFTTTPFGNNLVTLTLTGAQLRAVLEQQWEVTPPRILATSSGLTYSWSPSAPRGRKVDPASLALNGRPVDAHARYRVTVNSFLAAGGDGFSVLTEGKEQRGGPLDIDALVAYLKARSPLEPPALGRIRLQPQGRASLGEQDEAAGKRRRAAGRGE
ncbi:MAG: bifunctional metallophosphatase/5'-nucleotidase [Myxococcaceae bacterium]|nr:bifunctional metallophosphatase/5'-nucleotidase [Myxococcaceae bacterium]